MKHRIASDSPRFADLRFILRGSKRGLAVISITSLLTALCEAFLLGAVVKSISAISGGSTTLRLAFGPLSVTTSVTSLLGAAVVAAVVRGALVSFVAYTGPKIAAASRGRHRLDLFKTYLAADWSTQSADKTGRLLQTLSSSVNEANTIVLAMTQALPALITLIVLLTAALTLSPLITGSMVLLGLVIGLALRPLSASAHRAARADAQGRNATASHIGGVIAAGAEITILGSREGVLQIGHERIAGAEASFARAQGLKRVISQTSQSVAFLAAAIGLLFVAIVGPDVNFTTIGTITVLLLRGAGLAQAIQAATSQYGAMTPFIEQVRTLTAHYERHRQIFGEEPFPAAFDLTLQDVCYVYPGTSRTAVLIESASFERGTATAILGPSGSGKSTLIQLMLRLRDATSGVVLMGGVPVKSINDKEFSAQVAYVPQTPHLVPGTIFENIAFFRPLITYADVVAAARLAHVHDDIERMAHGYDTMLDSHVDSLSGGQKQRLALARALVAGPSLLVLDEPTSALDETNEAAVVDTLRQLRGETTVIMITHKPSTAAYCDVVLVLEQGLLRPRNDDVTLPTPPIVSRATASGDPQSP